ncbi:MAG: hypothetical protein HOK97_04660, partial [Deltaproteobacteria bacterium]|nr:hypothetical protein [Deltaproteobacteria bacterium]
SGNLYVWKHTVETSTALPDGSTSGSIEGTYSVLLQATDQAGNASSTIVGESIQIDSSYPSAELVGDITTTQVAGASITAPDKVTINGQPYDHVIYQHSITAIIELSDQTADTLPKPEVTIGGVPIVSLVLDGNNRWEATYDVTADLGDGLADIQATVRDLAGNEKVYTIATVFVDQTAPSLAFLTTSPEIVRNGGTATVILNFDELVRENINLFYQSDDGTTDLLNGSTESCEINSSTSATALGATNLADLVLGSSFVCTITTPFVDGTPDSLYASSYALEVYAEDFAGNARTFSTTEVDVALRFDQTAAQLEISELSTGRMTSHTNEFERFKTVNRGDRDAVSGVASEVTFKINSTEPLNTLSAFIGDYELSQADCGNTETSPDGGTIITCTYTLTGLEEDGYQRLKVNATDPAGNITTITGDIDNPESCVLFDFTPPTISYSSVSPELIPGNGTGMLTAIFSEPIQDLAYELQIKTGEEWAASTEASITTNLTPTDDGLMARYRIIVGGGTLANRRHQAQATGHDLSGNEFSQTINDIFTIDQVAPDLCAHTDTCSPKYQVGTWEDDAITRYFVNLNDKQTGASIAVVFGVTESLGSNPTVTIGSRPFGSNCEIVPNPSTVVYRCLYQMSGNETSGHKEIVVKAVDDAGNTTYRSLGDFLFDFDSPTFIAPIISYEPPTNAPVSRVTALSNGSKANLTFSTDQLTRLSNIQLTCGANTYSLGESTEDGNSFQYEVAFNHLAPSPADGVCQAQASLSDLMWIKPPANGDGPDYMMSLPADAAAYTLTQIGNTGESLSEEILIDNTAPTLSTIISTSNLKHLRMPNGALQASLRDGDGYVSSQYIVDSSLDDLSAAPASTLPIAYFDMGEGNGTGPADGTASCSENDDCGGTSMCNYQSGLCITARLLRFYNQDSTGTGANQGTLLGSIDFLAYDDSGSVSSVNLSTDSPEVWVEAVDTAGNISSRQALTTEWVVSLSGRTSLNGSVHPATGQQVSAGLASRAQGYADDIDESHGLGTVGDDTLQTAGYQTWQDLTLRPGTELPSNLMAPGLVYDQGRHKVILFSGENSNLQDNQFWEYDVDTKRWSSQQSPLAPTGRSGAMLVYDSIREVLVFFGGTTNSNVNDVEAFYADTWEYTLSKSTWTKIIPTTAPSARALSFAEFDESSGRVILFGGVTTKEDQSDNISLNDTWAYDTSTQDWTQLTTDTAPSPRHAGTMRINPSTKKMFLFGGETKAGDGTTTITFQDDLWIFDPQTTNWEEVSQTNTPGAVGSFGMVYNSERERLVLFGGRTGFGSMTATGPSSIVRDQQWEFNPASNTWQQVAAEGSPTGKCSFGMVYVPSSKEIITYGGQSLATVLGETTDYKAATNRWVQRATTANVPPSDRRGNAMVEITNTNDLFLFGGYTWDIPLVDGVPDPDSPELVMLNETWTFAEENLRWTEVDLPSGGPGPIADHQMVYTQRADPLDNRVILFGGRTTVPPEAGSENGGPFGQGYQGSTWAYNPAEIASERWKEVLEDGQGPTARIGHAMAYSTAQNKVVLYGGQIGDRYLADDYPNDTWFYDVAEAQWTDITGSVGAPPSARSFAKMVYMPDLDKFLLVGGVYVDPSGGDGPPGAPPGGGGDGEGESASYSVNAETWTFDLQTQTWTQLTPANSPTAVFAQYMAYNPKRGRVLMYGGNIEENEVINQTWEYDPIGNDWERVKPLKSGGPRGNGAMAWDSHNNTMNVFGGAQFEASFDDHWVLVPGEATHTLAVSTEQILLPDDTAIQGIKAIWRAGATSTGWLPASETTNGASLFAWDTTLGWRLVATNSEPSTIPGYVQWSSNDANDVRRLSAETNTTLNFMVRPTSGKESKESYLVSDYAEIRVTYTPGQD